MRLIISNKMASRIGRKGVYTYSTSGKIKTGFLVYDGKGRSIGIAYISDDEREFKKAQYGMAELFFDEQYEKEYNTHHIIRTKGEYLPFAKLKDIMAKNEQYELCIDDYKRRAAYK